MQEQDFNKNFEPRLWLKIFRYAWRNRAHVLGLCSMMIIVGLIDMAFPQFVRGAIDHFIMPRHWDGVEWFAAKYFALILIQSINVYVMICLAGRIETRMVYSIRKEGFAHLQALDFSYYDTTSVGWLMARMTNDAARLGDIIAWGLVDFFWGITVMIGYSVIMMWMNWKLALAALCVIPPLALVSWFFQRKILKSYRAVRKNNSLITASFNECIHGACTTKTLVREDANLHEFDALAGKMRRVSIRAAVLSSLYMPLVLLLETIGSGIALVLGGKGVLAGSISYGTLVAFTTYMVLFFDPIINLARLFAEFQGAQASAERVFSLLSTPVEIHNDEATSPLPSGIQGEIEFDHVEFSYKTGGKVLSGFNLHIRAGEKIALVGETGAGKTTIANLACRFYQPTGGRILIDGQDYTTIPLEQLQSRIGVVLQSPHLFSGSVRENIRYGRLDATDAEVEQAARMVNAEEFILRLKDGYDTEVGEGGGMLSTGQKQLISFARAILADPAIFILDEATSSVDTQTEFLIQEAVDRLLHGRTSFVVAHRLSTIRSADRILVLGRGKILEQGTHHELMKQKGHYFRLYTNQFMDEKGREILTA